MGMSLSAEWVEVPFRVLKEHGGMRLDAYLALRLHKYSRARVQGLIADGRVLRGGRPAKPAARVADGETVLIRYPRAAEPPVPHELMPVVYQDEHLVAIDKPGGTLSHPTDKILHNTVTTLLSKQLGRKVFLCHRLDRETSGIMVLTLDSGSARALYEQFLARSIRKEYLAVAFGKPSWTKTVVDAPIGKDGGEIKVKRAVGGEDGQHAVTELELAASDGALSLIRARPRTGRLHQIRAHLAHVGHPIVGDKLYVDGGQAYMKAVRRELGEGDLAALGARRQLLHAWRIELAHPKDGRRLTLEAPVPEDFPLRPEAA